jgi:DNA polymerase-1
MRKRGPQYETFNYDVFDDSLFTTWQPSPPPLVASAGIKAVELDCETNGLKWWKGDRPVGIGVCLPTGTTQYLPWGHAGGNLDEVVVKEWARRELRNVHITNLNTRFDVHMIREWGVDLEAQGCTFSDVGHQAALLDDHRQKFSLKELVAEFLDDEAKVERVGNITLDGSRMADYHAGVVAVRAEADARQVNKLKQIFAPRLEAEGLMRVLALENNVIPVVCEMERNGARIDVELLHQWKKEAEQEYLRCLWALSRSVGQFNVNSNDDWLRLFKHEGVPITQKTGKGKASFTDEVLKSIDNANIKLARRAKKLSSLMSKYINPYAERVESDGTLRYALHQLRAQKDEWSGTGEAGTVSGRFSSSELTDGEGVNIQQVTKVAKQRTAAGYDEADASHDDELFIVRNLFIPEDGKQFLSADAMQIEYRFFAAYSKSKRLIDVYKSDPKASFHRMMHAMLRPFREGLTYRQQKDFNFAVQYGAGLKKMSWMMGFITKNDFETLTKFKGNDHPLLEPIRAIRAIYDQELPEGKILLEQAKSLAEKRGYVVTLTGRRSRFPVVSLQTDDGRWVKTTRSHKALNAIIQGGAADVMKAKLVELHAERKTTGFTMRYTVHDEVDGDSTGPACTNMVDSILNRQSFPELAVPILWDVSTGVNWKNCA